jgi:hypothetical protein
MEDSMEDDLELASISDQFMADAMREATTHVAFDAE